MIIPVDVAFCDHLLEKLIDALRLLLLQARDVPLVPGPLCLPEDSSDPPDQRQGHDDGRDARGAVPADELACPVARLALAGGDGAVREIASDVIGEILHGLVAVLGLFPQCHEGDRVDVAVQCPADSVGR